jgi:hypothetical protein
MTSRSFTRAAEAVWNSLSETVRKVDSVYGFKKLLKTFLFSRVNWT